MIDDQKEMVDALKTDWKKLWKERLDDRLRAEGIAVSDYSSLYVEQGTIIHATRDFKILTFREILEKHKVENSDRFVDPSPHVGGWTKFVKTEIAPLNARRNKRAAAYLEEKKVVSAQQPKKGGRGWLHR